MTKKRTPVCRFWTLEDLFNFGRYRGLSLADVLDINPSYLDWCIKHCTSPICQLKDTAIDEIKTAYPNFIMDALFESHRFWNLEATEEDCSDDIFEFDYNDEEAHSYNRYSGSWAQDIEGYSDDDIDTIFDGDPSAYWNID